MLESQYEPERMFHIVAGLKQLFPHVEDKD